MDFASSFGDAILYQLVVDIKDEEDTKLCSRVFHGDGLPINNLSMRSRRNSLDGIDDILLTIYQSRKTVIERIFHGNGMDGIIDSFSHVDHRITSFIQ